MKNKLLSFLKIYAVFMLVALLINLSMELLIPTPESKDPAGIMLFYLIFSIPGSAVLLLKDYNSKKMGLLSLALGFIFEFTFMLPDWVMKIYDMSVGPGEIMAVIVSAFYWFIPWGVPAYILRKEKTRKFLGTD